MTYAATIDHLRADVSDIDLVGEVEQEATGGRAGRADLYLRHFEPEAPTYDRDESQSIRLVFVLPCSFIQNPAHQNIPFRTAICALSPSNENSYLAYPSPSPSPSTPFPAPPSGSSPNPSSGDVLIFDSITLSVTNIIQAHKTPVAALAINPQGTLLATASDKGTVIRVFSVPNGDKVAQFRRGSYPTRIWSLGFNSVSSLLCVSSDTETVHIFKLNKGGPSTGNGGKPGRLGRSESDFGGDDDGSSIGSRFSSRESSSSIGGYEAFIDSKRNSNGGVA